MSQDDQKETVQTEGSQEKAEAEINKQERLKAVIQLKKESDKKQQENFARQEFYRAQRNPQEERIAKFFDSAVDDVALFIKRTVGVSYDSKNNFSFSQKQKILSYMYFKNNEDLQKARMFTYLDVKAGNTKESIRSRLNHLQELKDYNRAYYIYNLAQCQNRLRITGYIWGSFAAAVVYNTIMKNSSVIRKVSISALIIHISSQVFSYRNIDRVFDAMYPLFYKDFQDHLKQEEEEKDDFLVRNTMREDEITELIKMQVYNPDAAKAKIEKKAMYSDEI